MDYTNIEQAKKLTELGFCSDSADMVFTYAEKDGEYTLEEYPKVRPYKDLYEEFLKHGFYKEHINKLIQPCWSVGALMKILAKKALEFDDDGSAVLTSWMGTWSVNMFDCPIECSDHYIEPIDACCEMIEKVLNFKK